MRLLDKLRNQKALSISLLLFTLSVGIIIGTLINTGVNAAKPQAPAPDATPLTLPPVAKLPPNEFVELARKLEPSVVNISTDYFGNTRNTRRGTPPQGEEEEDDEMDLFRRFFRNGPQGNQRVPPRNFRRQGTGTGFIVDKNGYILTNLHVIENADRIKVKMPKDQTEYRAKLIGQDEETDLAVIKIDSGRALAPVRIGNSDSIHVGDWAVAIGSPFGLEATVTAGIVSATGRDIDGARAFQKFIQTDAAINPGNSGGPLLNINGEVIGINTAIATATGAYQGVGFALPVNMAVDVYNSIIRTGKVSRGSIGITFRNYENSQQVLRALGLKEGVVVETVNHDGPAEKAGMKPLDVIVAFNGKTVRDGDDLVSRVSSSQIGSSQTVTVDRNGKRVDMKVVIGDREQQALASGDPRFGGRRGGQDRGESVAPEPSGAKFGLRIKPATQQQREAASIEKGVVVTEVEPTSFADDIGLQEGDIIVSINRQPVGTIEEVRSIQNKLKAGDAVAFRIMRRMPSPRGGTEYLGTFVAGTLPPSGQ